PRRQDGVWEVNSRLRIQSGGQRLRIEIRQNGVNCGIWPRLQDGIREVNSRLRIGSGRQRLRIEPHRSDRVREMDVRLRIRPGRQRLRIEFYPIRVNSNMGNQPTDIIDYLGPGG